VKFKIFLESALEDGADMIATGHYARVEDGKLMLAADEKKDQTYFLYRVSGEALKKTLFPLGGFTKPEVRRMAEERGLATAAKKDSQGICFVGSVGIKDFLSEFVETIPGDIIEKETGTKIGRHDGAIYYTIGQRHGLGLGGGLPYYVVGKDMAKNEVYVSRNLEADNLWTKEIPLTKVHWINDAPEDGAPLKIRLRHQGALLDGHIEGSKLYLNDSQRAVSSGQSAVMYQDSVCLGGGIVQ
jgi:tRNA-specific 2-thiouridylase